MVTQIGECMHASWTSVFIVQELEWVESVRHPYYSWSCSLLLNLEITVNDNKQPPIVWWTTLNMTSLGYLRKFLYLNYTSVVYIW